MLKLILSLSAFKGQYLVCIPDKVCVEFSGLSLEEVTRRSKKKKSVRVFALKRSSHGQVYMITDLATICHFALGSNAFKILQKIFDIRIVTGFPDEDVSTLPPQVRYCVSVSGRDPEMKMRSDHDRTLITMATKLAHEILPMIINLKKNVSDRVNYSFSLGLTGSKCHEYESFTIFNNVKPGLISNPGLTDEMLASFGNFAEYFSKVTVPLLRMQDGFFFTDALNEFAKQLFVDCSKTSRNFLTPAISCILPGISGNLLRPHRDLLNGMKGSKDYTFQVMVPVILNDLPEKTRFRISKTFGDKMTMLPVTFLFYTRRSLASYLKKKAEISSFCLSKQKETEGRQFIVEQFTDMGRTYHQRTFCVNGYKQISKECKILDEILRFSGIGISIDELSDKMVSTSLKNIIFFNIGCESNTSIFYYNRVSGH